LRLFCCILRFRTVGIVLGAMSFQSVWAQSDCDDVPEGRRLQCERVMDCMTIEDGDIRRACISTAQRSATDTSKQENAEEAPTLVDLVVLPRRNATQARRQADRKPPEPIPEAPEEEPVIQEASSDTLPDVPVGTFAGKITRIFESYQKRQIIAVGNRYVFESNDADEARFEVGQTVEGRESKSLFFGGGRKWRLIGPSTRPVEAFRIRCERDDIGRDNRRRCDRMLDP